MGYVEEVKNLDPVTFEELRNISVRILMDEYTEDERIELYKELHHGIDIIKRKALLMYYMFSYGLMHKAKLLKAFKSFVRRELKGKIIEIIDYGAGQAIASFVFLEYIRDKNIDISVKCITLIEPSKKALSRGVLHLNVINKNIDVYRVRKKMNNIKKNDLSTYDDVIKVHLFSNILDVDGILLGRLARKIRNSQNGKNYFVCVGPYNGWADRIDFFYENFENRYRTKSFLNYENNNWNNGWTIKARVFKVKM